MHLGNVVPPYASNIPVASKVVPLTVSAFAVHVKSCWGWPTRREAPQPTLECWDIVSNMTEGAPAGSNPWASVVEAGPALHSSKIGPFWLFQADFLPCGSLNHGPW